MLTVRKYEEKDKEGVRFACLNSDGPAESENFGKFGMRILVRLSCKNLKKKCFYYFGQNSIC